jgi:hypothetical protein
VQVVHGTRNQDDPTRKWYTGEDLQRIQKLEDDVNEVILAVNGNVEVLSAMQTFYEDVIQHQHWTLPASCVENVGFFSKATRHALYDLRMQSSRARALAKHTGERKHLVSPLFAEVHRTVIADMVADTAICTNSNCRKYGGPHEMHI